MVGGLLVAFYLSWQLSLVMLACCPLLGLAIGIQGRFMVTFAKKSAAASADALSTAEEVRGANRGVLLCIMEYSSRIS